MHKCKHKKVKTHLLCILLHHPFVDFIYLVYFELRDNLQKIILHQSDFNSSDVVISTHQLGLECTSDPEMTLFLKWNDSSPLSEPLDAHN